MSYSQTDQLLLEVRERLDRNIRVTAAVAVLANNEHGAGALGLLSAEQRAQLEREAVDVVSEALLKPSRRSG